MRKQNLLLQIFREPKLSLAYSDDGGETWETETFQDQKILANVRLRFIELGYVSGDWPSFYESHSPIYSGHPADTDPVELASKVFWEGSLGEVSCPDPITSAKIKKNLDRYPFVEVEEGDTLTFRLDSLEDLARKMAIVNLVVRNQLVPFFNGQIARRSHDSTLFSERQRIVDEILQGPKITVKEHEVLPIEEILEKDPYGVVKDIDLFKPVRLSSTRELEDDDLPLPLWSGVR